MSDTFPEAFREKRGSCSCSTSGTQFSCSCCQGIKGLKGKSHFVVECRLVNSADYMAIQGPLLKSSLCLCLSDYGSPPPPPTSLSQFSSGSFFVCCLSVIVSACVDLSVYLSASLSRCVCVCVSVRLYLSSFSLLSDFVAPTPPPPPSCLCPSVCLSVPSLSSLSLSVFTVSVCICFSVCHCVCFSPFSVSTSEWLSVMYL